MTLFLEGLATKARELLSYHQVKLTLTKTNPVFLCFRVYSSSYCHYNMNSLTSVFRATNNGRKKQPFNKFLRQHATFCLHDYSRYLNFRVTNKYWPSLKP